ncbi:hypothetical protein TgHK011_005022 [Trichoderma gracile]|nr:hypothetical protein TgHK011_005022 [Trichoderma gracile]
MESLADAGLAAMQRFKLLQQFEVQEAVLNEFKNWPKEPFLAQFDRFELWAVNLGLFVMGHGSLDYRIRDSESMRDAILKMVMDLTRSLDEVLDYLNEETEQEDEEFDTDSDTESDMDLLLDSVKDPIDRLYKMAVWIRNPATRMPSSKARNFQQIDQETKVDLFKAFEHFDYDYISSLFLQYEKNKALQESPAAKCEEEVDDLDNQDQVCEPDKTTLKLSKLKTATGTESYLVHRIAQANGRRRQQFAYWRSHKDKLRAHSSVVVDAPTHELPSGGHEMAAGNQNASIKAPLTITTATQLRPSRGEAKEVFEKANLLDHAVSEYAPSAWEPSKDIVSFPLPPRVSATEQFFECPYCFTICPVSILSEKAWRAHLIRDLRPYICTFEHCSSSDQLYDSRDDWIQHEMSAHQTMFQCPRHPDDTFNTSEAYERHIQNQCHGETLSLSLAKSAPTNIQRSCPQRLELVYEVKNALQEVDEALGPGADLQTEPGKSLALKKLARTALGMHHAETIWGPSIRGEMTKLKADHDMAVLETVMGKRKDGADSMEHNAEGIQEWTGSEPEALESEKPIETGEINALSKEMTRTPTSDAVSAQDEQRRDSLSEEGQKPMAPPQGSDEDEERPATATPIRRFEQLHTNDGGTASDTMSSRAAAAEDEIVHEGGVSWKPNRDEYSQPNVSFDFGKFSDRLTAEEERNLFTPTDDPERQEMQAGQQIQEDSEMEEERMQMEREMQVFRHVFHPLWVEAQLERQSEAKARETQDMEGQLIAHQLEADLRTYRDGVEELERQFLRRDWKRLETFQRNWMKRHKKAKKKHARLKLNNTTLRCLILRTTSPGSLGRSAWSREKMNVGGHCRPRPAAGKHMMKVAQEIRGPRRHSIGDVVSAPVAGSATT